MPCRKNNNFNDYKNILFDDKIKNHYVHNIHAFRTKKFKQQTFIQSKKAFDNNDDKRVSIPNSFKTYAHGHFATK